MTLLIDLIVAARLELRVRLRRLGVNDFAKINFQLRIENGELRIMIRPILD